LSGICDGIHIPPWFSNVGLAATGAAGVTTFGDVLVAAGGDAGWGGDAPHASTDADTKMGAR
jgi:hypothetical protein